LSFKITILGSSGALPAFGRFPSCQLVEIQNRHFLVDCGEGAQMQMMKHNVSMHRISHIFISHLHGDHYLGLPGLVFTMHLLKRTNDLHIHAPKGLDEILTTQFRYSNSAPSFRIHFHQTNTTRREILMEDDALTVESIPLVHKLPCAGFLFREKEKPRRIDKDKLPSGLKIMQIASLKRGADIISDDGEILYRNEELTLPPRKSRSYAYCSDTAFHPPIAEQIKNVDVLYHEATFMDDEKGKAQETKHSTVKEAAMMANLAHADRLLIGHFSARYRELDPVIEEAKSIFQKTELAIEGSSFTIAE